MNLFRGSVRGQKAAYGKNIILVHNDLAFNSRNSSCFSCMPPFLHYKSIMIRTIGDLNQL